jgi:hypothetical protein
MAVDTDSYPSARLIAELAREAQLQQLQSLDSLDTKATSILGLAGVLLGLVFTSSVAVDRWSLVLTIGAGFIGASIVLFALAIAPRRYRFNPNISALAPAYMGEPEDETYRITIASIENAILHNANNARRKVNFLRLGFALVVVGLLLVTIGLIVAAAQGPLPKSG